ncbi:MAG TPA: MBL fold metallo-hydrolase [Anaerolineae bacterium]|nr:MBL fold metallo-hydrolase [Anaerolineae bacterium]
MPTIKQLPLGPLQTNCYLLVCDETQHAAVIDPSWEGHTIAKHATDNGYNITHILLTHSHFDHIAGLAEIKQDTNAPIYIHADAVPGLTTGSRLAQMWNITFPEPPPHDELITADQTFTIGHLTLHALYTPGHAPGHISFYLPSHGVVFAGDTLFQQSIGRTDLPGGDHPLLIQSITDKLLSLPDDTQVLPGHGPVTTIGQEKQWNPFLR